MTALLVVVFVFAASLTATGAAVSAWSFDRGRRYGMRCAARICAESARDPRAGFAAWLREQGEEVSEAKR